MQLVLIKRKRKKEEEEEKTIRRRRGRGRRGKREGGEEGALKQPRRNQGRLSRTRYT